MPLSVYIFEVLVHQKLLFDYLLLMHFTMRDTCIIVQTESRTSSLFECFAEVQPILYKEYTLFAR